MTTATPALESEVVFDSASIARDNRARRWRGLWRRGLSVLALLLLWQVVSLFMKESILPSPIAVFAQLGVNLTQPDTYVQLGATMFRVVIGM
ncbi:MAG TPA: hypothetical protein VIL55_05335, partial [Naasia sp.]